MKVDWYKWNKRIERWEFNHRTVDNGLDAPIPMTDIQKSAWKGAKWRKETVCEALEGDNEG